MSSAHNTSFAKLDERYSVFQNLCIIFNIRFFFGLCLTGKSTGKENSLQGFTSADKTNLDLADFWHIVISTSMAN